MLFNNETDGTLNKTLMVQVHQIIFVFLVWVVCQSLSFSYYTVERPKQHPGPSENLVLRGGGDLPNFGVFMLDCGEI